MGILQSPSVASFTISPCKTLLTEVSPQRQARKCSDLAKNRLKGQKALPQRCQYCSTHQRTTLSHMRSLASVTERTLSKPILIAIKGTVFDVSRNRAYQPEGPYCVYAGKDPSRALALSSLKPEDCVPEWYDLEDVYKTVLSEWHAFLSKRYNIVGKVRISSLHSTKSTSKL